MIVILTALALTCVIEALATLIICLIARFDRRRTCRTLFYNLLCNLFTNPILNLTIILLYQAGVGQDGYRITVIIGEILVLAVEYGIYRLVSKEKRGFCLILSVVTNLASFLTGLLIG